MLVDVQEEPTESEARLLVVPMGLRESNVLEAWREALASQKVAKSAGQLPCKMAASACVVLALEERSDMRVPATPPLTLRYISAGAGATHRHPDPKWLDRPHDGIVLSVLHPHCSFAYQVLTAT